MLQEEILNKWKDIISRSSKGKVEYPYVDAIMKAFPSQVLQLTPRDGSHCILFGQNIFLVKDSFGNNLLNLAAKANNPSLIYFLLSQGVDPEEVNSEGKDFKAIYLESPPLKTSREVSSFLETCEIKQSSQPQILLANKLPADIFSRFIRKFCVDYKERDPSIYFNVSTPNDHINDKRDSLLHVCARNNLDLFLEGLISEGLEVNTRNRNGITPLMIAAEFNNPSPTDKLLKCGADPNSRDVLGKTALMKAINFGASACIKAIIADSRTDLLIADNAGDTADDQAQISSPRVKKVYMTAVEGRIVKLSPVTSELKRTYTSEVEFDHNETLAPSSRRSLTLQPAVEGTKLSEDILDSVQEATSGLVRNDSISSKETIADSAPSWIEKVPLKARKKSYTEYFDSENNRFTSEHSRAPKSFRK